MDKEQVLKIAQKFANKITIDFKVRKVVIYGSWIHGNANEDSDIDIAVIVRDINSDYLDSLIKLYHIASEVDNRIEPLLFEENTDESGFLGEILSQGELVYDNRRATI